MESIDIFLASDSWYVVYCKPRKELYAASILGNQLGLIVYLPEIVTHLHKETQRTPFFSGYFFIQANLQTVALSRINSCPGVLKLLDFGEGPLVVSEEVLMMIREEVDRYNAYRNLSHQKLCPGDLVRVVNGPLKGVSAVFMEALTSDERARVLLHFLGRVSKVQLDADSLEKLCSEPPQRERKTRGKGRRINRNHIAS